MRAHFRLAALVVAAAGVFSACSESITGEAEQVGVPALNFALDPSNARGIGAGGNTITSYAYSLIAPLPADAFARSGTSGAAIGYSTGACSVGRTRCFQFPAFLRDSARDPRLPRMMAPPSIPVTASFIDVAGPENFGTTAGVKAFELFARLNNLKPSTAYSMNLVRYGLVVRGQLDAIEMLAFGKVTEPDSLVLLGGAPGGFPTVNYNWTSPNSSCNTKAAPVGANPFFLGPATTSSAGLVTFDKCFGSGSIWYRDSSKVVPDSSPFIRNSVGARVIAQQYNYIEFSEGSTAGGRVVARVQVGADLDPGTGNVIPNAFAPFPAARVSPGVLISTLKVALGGPSGVRMKIIPLEQLTEGAAYDVVLVNRESGAITRARALYYTITRDTTGKDALGNVLFTEVTSGVSVVDAITGGASNVTHYIEVQDSLNAGFTVRSFTDLALRPTAITGAVPLWSHYLDRRKTDDSQDDAFFDASPIVFGTLPIAPDAVPYVFRPAGSARGTNRGTEIGISFEHLPRPPVGYYYNVWLVGGTGDTVTPVSLGALTTPLPEGASLRDADIAPSGALLTPTEILRANLLVRPAELAAAGIQLGQYALVRLTLEAKDGVPAIAPVVVLEGAFVTPVR